MPPRTHNKLYIVIGIVTILLLVLFWHKDAPTNAPVLDATPKNVTLSGTYTCLPHLDTKAPTTDECVFGLKTDDGEYYMVNFGQSASAMEQFNKRAHITAEGFVVIKEALSTDKWVKYNMKGIFTITKVLK
jgi:hypothetical protein